MRKLVVYAVAALGLLAAGLTVPCHAAAAASATRPMLVAMIGANHVKPPRLA